MPSAVYVYTGRHLPRVTGHGRLRRLQHPHDGLCLIVYGADLREARHLVVDVQEAGDAAGRRGVHDDVVVGEPPRPVLAAHRLARLAGQQDVPEAGRDGGREVDRAQLLQRPARAAELVEHLEIVQKGQFRIDGEGVHLAAARSDRDLPLLVRKCFRLEELRDALPALDLHEKRPLPLGREGQRECGGDRRLSGPALAADDLEPAHIFETNQSGRHSRGRLWITGAVVGRRTLRSQRLQSPP
ncbi:hypothetical protein SCANM63S_02862 [Streptomyces canarius]